MDELTRYGKSIDLARKKIRRQKNRFGEKEFLLLQIPIEPAPDAPVMDPGEYTENFYGRKTPLVLILSGGEEMADEQWNEKAFLIESDLCARGFLIVALVREVPFGEGLKRFSFTLRDLIYTGKWKNEKILASADAL